MSFFKPKTVSLIGQDEKQTYPPTAWISSLQKMASAHLQADIQYSNDFHLLLVSLRVFFVCMCVDSNIEMPFSKPRNED